jgi:hypothetical protein
MSDRRRGILCSGGSFSNRSMSIAGTPKKTVVPSCAIVAADRSISNRGSTTSVAPAPSTGRGQVCVPVLV